MEAVIEALAPLSTKVPAMLVELFWGLDLDTIVMI